jgi:hypothetical protein
MCLFTVENFETFCWFSRSSDVTRYLLIRKYFSVLFRGVRKWLVPNHAYKIIDLQDGKAIIAFKRSCRVLFSVKIRYFGNIQADMTFSFAFTLCSGIRWSCSTAHAGFPIWQFATFFINSWDGSILIDDRNKFNSRETCKWSIFKQVSINFYSVTPVYFDTAVGEKLSGWE